MGRHRVLGGRDLGIRIDTGEALAEGQRIQQCLLKLVRYDGPISLQAVVTDTAT